MKNKFFVDTNIWLYLFLEDNSEKHGIASEYITKNESNFEYVITYQVINEMTNVLLKNGFTEIKILEIIDYVIKSCTVLESSKEIILIASSIRERFSISFWDSILVGSALFAKCDTLVSEDMQDGLMIDNKLLIKNIF
jgi:predicted nucleic acid-binding protein